MYKLIIQDDEGKTTVVPLIRDEITIGRKEGNTIRLTERNVSRRHARIMKSNGSVLVEDLDSYNGVKVNGTRVQGRIAIGESDRVQIGDYLLELKVDRGSSLDVPAFGDRTPPPQPMPQMATVPAPVAMPSPSASSPGMNGGPPPAAPSAMATNTAMINLNTLNTSRKTPPPMPVGPGAGFNANGGSDLASAASSPQAAPGEAGRLVVVSSNFAGKEFLLDKPALVIGRTEDNDIVVNHRSISRHHAKIVREQGRYAIVDMQSANGVRVNGEEYGKVELRRGDMIDLGHVRLRYVDPGENFVFDRDATVVDISARGGKGGSKTLIIGVVAVLAVVAVVVLILVMSGGKKEKGGGDQVGKPTNTSASNTNASGLNPASSSPSNTVAASKTSAPPANDTEKALQDARDAMSAHKWADAAGAAALALKTDAKNAEAKQIKDQATAELGGQGALERLSKDVDAGNIDQALKDLKDIPMGASQTHADAEAKLSGMKSQYVAKEQEDANAAAGRGDCAAIKTIAKQVRSVFPDSADAIAATACTPSQANNNSTAVTPPHNPVVTSAAAPPPPTADFNQLLADAKQAFGAGQFGDAKKKAEAALNAKGDSMDAMMLAGMASCALHQKNDASKYIDEMPAGRRQDAMKSYCTQQGITIP